MLLYTARRTTTTTTALDNKTATNNLLLLLLLLSLLLTTAPSITLATQQQQPTIKQHNLPQNLISSTTYQPGVPFPDSADAPLPLSTLLVSTLDGCIHALDKRTGKPLWTWSSDSPLLSTRSTKPPSVIVPTDADDDLDLASEDHLSSTTPPLTSRREEDFFAKDQGILDLVDVGFAPSDALSDVAYIPEPTADGNLYMYAPGNAHKLEKLKMPIKDLVNKAPFWTSDGTIYLGSKSTKFYSLDPATGALLEAFGDNGTMCENGKSSSRDSLFLGRIEYKLSIRNKNGRVWEVSYGEFIANDLAHSRPPSLSYETPYVTEGGGGGVASNVLADVWQTEFKTPAIAVFDIYKSDLQESFLVSRQPRDPSLSRVIREFATPGAVSTAYVGHLDGQLFALSSEQYPLVPFQDKVKASVVESDYTGKTRPPSAISSCRSESSDFPECLVGNHMIANDVVRTIDYPNAEDTSRNENSALATVSENRRRVTVSVPVPRLATAIYDALKSQGFGPAILRIFTAVVIVAVSSFYINRRFRNSRSQTSAIQMPAAPGTGRRKRRGVAGGSGADLDGTSSIETLALLDSQPGDVFGEQNSVISTAAPSSSPVKKRTNRKRGRGGKGSGKSDDRSTSPPAQARAATPSTAAQMLAEEKPLPTLPELPTLPLDIATAVIPPSVDPLLPYTPDLKLLTLSSTVLGYGSHGTIVYKGRFEDRDVAVKRLLMDFYDIAQMEVQLLRESDDHPHVVRYFCKEQCDRFMYIALELCPASLFDVVERPSKEHFDLLHHLPANKMLYQIASGVHHLHSLKIVHRDIKPQNILIASGRASSQGVNGSQLLSSHHGHRNHPRMLISDFGLCKRLEHDQSSFNNLTQAAGGGTVGWRAPECLLHSSQSPLVVDTSDSSFLASGTDSKVATDDAPTVRITRAIDIFSLGCLFYYVLSGGDHPFGTRYDREANILKSRFDLHKLDIFGTEGAEAKELIARMISYDPKSRPNASAVLSHPFFWSNGERLNFLLDASDRLELEVRDPPSPLLVALESDPHLVLGHTDGWHKLMDRSFMESLGKYRKYESGNVRDLLRALRNKKHHFLDLPDHLKRMLGSVPDGFLAYFQNKFPNLLLHVYTVIKNDPRVRREAVFRPYFGES